MDPAVLALATTAFGACLGGLGTLWLERRRRANEDDRSLQEKIHDLEVRIVRLEVEVSVVNRLASGVIREEADG